MGEVLVAQGKLQEALVAYQQGLAIAKALAERDKINSGWQRDLSVSYEKVGDVLVAQGDLAGALKNYRDEFAITEKLASQNPTNADSQNGAAWSRYCLAKVLILIKDGASKRSKSSDY